MSVIARSEFWTLYSALNSRTGYKACIQVLEEPFANDMEATIHFMQQRDIGKKMMHKNILRAHESQVIEGIPVIEYDYFQGVSFRDFVEKKHILPKVRIQFIWIKIARTLQHAQLSGTSHGCPDHNHILIDPETDQIKIFGFGIHYLYDFLYPIYPDKFTPILPFIQPEAIQSHSIVTRKSDGYAFGVLCYYMLTRKIPFYSNSIPEIIADKQYLPPSPKDINTHVPVLLADLTMSLLHPKPNHRGTLNTFLDYLDPQVDENIYPDLRKRVFSTKRILNRFSKHGNRFSLGKITGLLANHRHLFLPGLGILIILFISIVALDKIRSDQKRQIDVAYQSFIQSHNDEKGQVADKTDRYEKDNAANKQKPTANKKNFNDSPATSPKEQASNKEQKTKLTVSAFSETGPLSARVLINNIFMGQTDPGMPLSLSMHTDTEFTLSVLADDYKDWERPLELNNQDTSVQAKLVLLNKPRTLFIAETDFADYIRIDQGTYRALPVRIRIEKGEHRLLFLDRETGFETEHSIKITDSSSDTLKFDRSLLGAGSGLFVLRNAEQHGYVFVRLDGSQTQQTTPFKTKLTAGPHRATFYREGYDIVPKDTLFYVNPDQQVKITCKILR